MSLVRVHNIFEGLNSLCHTCEHWLVSFRCLVFYTSEVFLKRRNIIGYIPCCKVIYSFITHWVYLSRVEIIKSGCKCISGRSIIFSYKIIVINIVKYLTLLLLFILISFKECTSLKHLIYCINLSFIPSCIDTIKTCSKGIVISLILSSYKTTVLLLKKSLLSCILYLIYISIKSSRILHESILSLHCLLIVSFYPAPVIYFLGEILMY